jgi:hypothetical protein
MFLNLKDGAIFLPTSINTIYPESCWRNIGERKAKCDGQSCPRKPMSELKGKAMSEPKDASKDNDKLRKGNLNIPHPHP